MKQIYTRTRCCMALLMLLFTINLQAQQISFPGAEGAGKFTSGGRGTITAMTTVFEVTNLTDVNSVGSLRYACSQSIATYPNRTIVFKLSGTIHLNSRLPIPANTTIAGQTAPGEGICVADYPVVINGNNVIIRYMRFRMGDKNQLKTTPTGCGVPVAPFTAACMPLDGSGGDDALGDLGHKNIMVDHCTVSWSNDEALTMYRGDSLTLQWNMISEPLNYSYHFETGDADFEHHGYGGIWGALHGSFHHNLFAHCQSRNPRFAGNSTYSGSIESADFRNNVIYDWGLYTVYGGEGGEYNVVNNYYKYGPSTGAATRYRIVNVDSSAAFPLAKYFLSGNYVDGSITNTNNNWTGAYMMGGNAADSVKSKVTIPFLPNYLPATTDAAIAAYDTVLKSVGCTIPARDTLDQRIINDVKNRTGKTIDCQGGFPHGTPYAQTVNAWPALASTTPPIDTDHDGMPDDWETTNGLNPNNAADRGHFAPNGYTNLENYLNGITGAVVVIEPESSTAASATWSLLTDQTASTIGSVTAASQTLGSYLAGIQYGNTFGTVPGWQRTGTTSFLPIGYDANSYVEYKIAPNAGKYFTTTSLEFGALGGGTGTAKLALYYSLDNFVTSAPMGACTYNGTSYDATTTGTPIVLLNTSTTPLTGQQIGILPTSISVAPAQTLTFRLYVWITGTGNRYFPSQNVTIKGVTSDAPLPLLLTSFSVSTLDHITTLIWQTANETNMQGFGVEKSTDGLHYNTIGTITAANKISNGYSFNDYSMADGIVYYRLRLLNKDGSFWNSQIVTLNKKTKTQLSIYPNPATESFTLFHEASTVDARVTIRGMDGRIQQQVKLPVNSNYDVLDVRQLPTGIFLLQYFNGKIEQTTKFIKR